MALSEGEDEEHAHKELAKAFVADLKQRDPSVNSAKVQDLIDHLRNMRNVADYQATPLTAKQCAELIRIAGALIELLRPYYEDNQ